MDNVENGWLSSTPDAIGHDGRPIREGDAVYPVHPGALIVDEILSEEKAVGQFRVKVDYDLFKPEALTHEPMCFYRFPAMAKLGEWTNGDQVLQIMDEAEEAVSAYSFWCYGSGSGDKDADRGAYGMELMDVIHATETALRMEFTPEEVNELRDAVEEKNRKRGYYGKEA